MEPTICLVRLEINLEVCVAEGQVGSSIHGGQVLGPINTFEDELGALDSSLGSIIMIGCQKSVKRRLVTRKRKYFVNKSAPYK